LSQPGLLHERVFGQVVVRELLFELLRVFVVFVVFVVLVVVVLVVVILAFVGLLRLFAREKSGSPSVTRERESACALRTAGMLRSV